MDAIARRRHARRQRDIAVVLVAAGLLGAPVTLAAAYFTLKGVAGAPPSWIPPLPAVVSRLPADMIEAKERLRGGLAGRGLEVVPVGASEVVIMSDAVAMYGLSHADIRTLMIDSSATDFVGLPHPARVVLEELSDARTAADRAADFPAGRAASRGKLLLFTSPAPDSPAVLSKVLAALDGR